ncbi:MAG: precorrin-6y C5,15-methyltransferase (decarboxylating) subunit CbiE [Bacteroidaceae bacterium]|nr:precorrin-6y C5,15-methyltransferase (decarboxylating) subunit CbiE [Bacteroidaceae bacterium]
MKQIFVIGMSDISQPEFSLEVRRLVASGSVFSGGKRHREIVQSLLPDGARWVDITVPLSDVFNTYRKFFSEGVESIIVFASGDPLFYGMASTLRREMADVNLHTFPYFHSLQLLAHRLSLPYQGLRPVSLTGRPWQEFDRALIERSALIGVLTDSRLHTPSLIAQRMLDYGYSSYRMHLGERLGNETLERVRSLSLSEAAALDAQSPNCLILEADALPPRPFGIPDDAFLTLEGRPGMITKMPIRLLSLQAMELSARRVLWDVGFCTGSVSIEARLLFPHLAVVAFEVREEGRQLMEQNAHRHGALGITSIIGNFLDLDCHSLPRPDVAFLGGYGGRMAEVLSKLRQFLLPGGTVVFNAVSPESEQLFLSCASALGFKPELSRHVAIDQYHPITILKCTCPSS